MSLRIVTSSMEGCQSDSLENPTDGKKIHCSDVIIGTMASQIIVISIVC